MQGLSPPSIFVGRFGYPKVMAGPAAQSLEGESMDLAPSNPAALRSEPLERIASAHLDLIRGRALMNVKSAASPDAILETSQEIAMAEKPVDLEVEYQRPVLIGGTPTFDSLTQPVGSVADIQSVDITANTIIPRKVDSIIDESDLLTNDAMDELSQSGIGEAHLSRLLSAGLLGRDEARQLVPTRWSITATDDTLGKQMFKQIIDAPTIYRVEVYEATRLDNNFQIILAPGLWAFQLLEVWAKGALWTAVGTASKSDWEEDKPRSDYVKETAGAYHAARLGVLESLVFRKRMAACLIHRVIGPGYWAPVGVWLVRETVRDAMLMKPKLYDKLSDALESIAIDSPVPSKVRDGWFSRRSRQTRLDAF